MEWIQAKVSYLNVPHLLYLESNNKLHLPHQSYSNDLLDAARINTTFVPDPVPGTCVSHGVYDGVIGTLQSNLSDFSIEFGNFESIMSEHCPEFPVAFDTIYRQDTDHIVSIPDRNVTRVNYAIHESFLVFDHFSAMFMIAVYVLSAILLRTSATINRSRKNVWKLTRLWFYQDADDGNVNLHSQRTILNCSKLHLALLFTLVGALINTDLVSYSKPALIDSVDDAIASNYKILLDTTSPVYSILKAASNGSNAKRFLEHAQNQSAKDGIPFLVPRKNKEMYWKLRERSPISIQNLLAFRVTDRMDCSRTDARNGGPFFHRSKEVVFEQHYTIFYSRACGVEVRMRVRRVHGLAMEAGLFVRGDAAQNLFDTLYSGKVSVYCLYKVRVEESPAESVVVAVSPVSLTVMTSPSEPVSTDPVSVSVSVYVSEFVELPPVEPVGPLPEPMYVLYRLASCCAVICV